MDGVLARITLPILLEVREEVRRNLLVLTGIFLLAVLLAGCELMPIVSGINVTYDIDANVFGKHSYPKQLRKNAMFEGVFWFLETQRGRTVDDFLITVDDGTLHGVEFEARNVAGTDFEGIYLQIPDVGTRDITITIKLR